MKTILITLIAALMVMTSFDTRHEAGIAANRMAQQIVSALHKSSAFHYSALYPPVEAFYQLMEENTALYGANFQEAKAAFANEYQAKVIPAMNKSFEEVLIQGKKSGMDWRSIKFERVECQATEQELAFAPITIVFSTNNEEHKLVIDKAIYYNGQWKVSQFISLN
jgi:hypothetical protein